MLVFRIADCWRTQWRTSEGGPLLTHVPEAQIIFSGSQLNKSHLLPLLLLSVSFFRHNLVCEKLLLYSYC